MHPPNRPPRYKIQDAPPRIPPGCKLQLGGTCILHLELGHGNGNGHGNGWRFAPYSNISCVYQKTRGSWRLMLSKLRKVIAQTLVG